MAAGPVRVLLVDNSAIGLVTIQRMLSSSSDIQVVGTARNGREALDLIAELKPSIICTDLHMPVMNGLELTRRVMTTQPLPILVVSISVSEEEDAHNILPLLEAGALDVFPKPDMRNGTDFDESARDLVRKVRVLSGVVPFRKKSAAPRPAAPSTGPMGASTAPGSPEIVSIGASTGGPPALQTVLSRLPASFPAPIVCVQHISDGFLGGLVRWLDEELSLEVKIAEPGETPQAGTVYFPEERTHLEISGQRTLSSSQEDRVDGHRPSVTITLQSVAERYGKTALGVLLTGMGKDGALGMQAISRAGGTTIVQDKSTSVVFGMPRQAIALGAAEHVLPLSEIATQILKVFPTPTKVTS